MFQFPEEGAVRFHGPAESARAEGECRCRVRVQCTVAGARINTRAPPCCCRAPPEGARRRPRVYINDVWGAAGVRAASARSARCHSAGTAAALTEGFADLTIPPPGSVSVREPSPPPSAVLSAAATAIIHSADQFCCFCCCRVLPVAALAHNTVLRPVALLIRCSASLPVSGDGASCMLLRL